MADGSIQVYQCTAPRKTWSLSSKVKTINQIQAPIVVDSMVVQRARGESQSTSGSLQSLCWGSSAFGGIVSAYCLLKWYTCGYLRSKISLWCYSIFTPDDNCCCSSCK